MFWINLTIQNKSDLKNDNFAQLAPLFHNYRYINIHQVFLNLTLTYPEGLSEHPQGSF